MLIFDLDGTISDPSLGIGRCVNHALETHGYSAVSDAQVAAVIGPPLDEIFRGFCPNAPAPIISALVATYRERYGAVGYAENTLYPGVEAALGKLAVAHVPMAVCTSKRRDYAERILAMFDLLELFRFVDGGDVGISKAQQLAALRECGAIDGPAMMIGDRDVDIAAARSNGLRAVGVLWGFGSERELCDAGADEMLNDPAELLSLAPGR